MSNQRRDSAVASCEQLNTWLSEAQAALHDIVIGGKIVEVQDQNLERVSYSRANVDQLRKYIAELTSQIATQCGAQTLAAAYGPLRPFF